MLSEFNLGVRDELLLYFWVELPLHVRPMRIARQELLEGKAAFVS